MHRLTITDKRAMIVVGKEGFIDWAWSSEPLLKSGVFYGARQEVIELPPASLEARNRIEAEANTFASYLLMPLDDFREQIKGRIIDIDVMTELADRYAVSLTPTATKKRGKLYRYYVSMDVIKNRTTEDEGGDQAPTRLPAGMVEDAIVTEVRRILQTPEVVTQVLAALKRDQVSEAEAIAALHDFNTLWAQLFPLEQARIIQLLVRRVTVTTAGLEVDIRREGVAGVIREMIAPRDMEAAE